MEQVAAVLDALSDAEDAVRQRVISLVERLTLKIDRSNVERQKYREEISQLRIRLTQLQEENLQLYYDNTQLRQQLDKVCVKLSTHHVLAYRIIFDTFSV